jgi:hypothetical protein
MKGIFQLFMEIRPNKSDKDRFDALNIHNHQPGSISSRFDLRNLDQMSVQAPSTSLRIIPRQQQRPKFNVNTTPIIPKQSPQNTPTFSQSPRIRNIVPANRTNAPEITRNSNGIRIEKLPINKPPILKKRQLVRKTCTMPISKHPYFNLTRFEEPISTPSSPRKMKKIVSRNASPELIEVDQEKLRYLETLLNQRGVHKFQSFKLSNSGPESFKSIFSEKAEAVKFVLPNNTKSIETVKFVMPVDTIQSGNTESLKCVMPMDTICSGNTESVKLAMSERQANSILSEKVKFVLSEKAEPVTSILSEKADAVKFVLPEKPVDSILSEKTEPVNNILSGAKPQQPTDLITKIVTKSTPPKTSIPIDQTLLSTQKSQELVKYIEKKKRESKKLQKLESQKKLELEQKIQSEQAKLKEYQLKQREQVRLLREKKELERRVLEKANAEKAMFDKERKEREEKEMLVRVRENEEKQRVLEKAIAEKKEVGEIPMAGIKLMEKEQGKQLAEMKLVEKEKIEKEKLETELLMKVGLPKLPSSVTPGVDITMVVTDIDPLVKPTSSNTIELTDLENIKGRKPTIHNDVVVGEPKNAKLDILKAKVPAPKPIIENDPKDGNPEPVSLDSEASPSIEKLQPVVDDQELLARDFEEARSKHNNARLATLTQLVYSLGERFETLTKPKETTIQKHHSNEQSQIQKPAPTKIDEEEVGVYNLNNFNNHFKNELKRKHAAITIQAFYKRRIKPKTSKLSKKEQMSHSSSPMYGNTMVPEGDLRDIMERSSHRVVLKGTGNFVAIDIDGMVHKDLKMEVGSKNDGLSKPTKMALEKGDKADLSLPNPALVTDDKLDTLEKIMGDEDFLVKPIQTVAITSTKTVTQPDEFRSKFTIDSKLPDPTFKKDINIIVPKSKDAESMVELFAKRIYQKTKNVEKIVVGENYKLSCCVVEDGAGSVAGEYLKDLGREVTAAKDLGLDLQLAVVDQHAESIFEHCDQKTEEEQSAKVVSFAEKSQTDKLIPDFGYGSTNDHISSFIEASQQKNELVESQPNEIKETTTRKDRVNSLQLSDMEKGILSSNSVPVPILKPFINRNTKSPDFGYSSEVEKAKKSTKAGYSMDYKIDSYSLDFENEKRSSHDYETDEYILDFEKDTLKKSFQDEYSMEYETEDSFMEDSKPASPPPRRTRKRKPKNILMSTRQIDPQEKDTLKKSFQDEYSMEYETEDSFMEDSKPASPPPRRTRKRKPKNILMSTRQIDPQSLSQK